MSNRHKFMYISHDLLPNLLRPLTFAADGTMTAFHADAMPDDLRIVDISKATIAYWTGNDGQIGGGSEIVWRVVVESASFAEVTPGEPLPEWKPQFSRTTVRRVGDDEAIEAARRKIAGCDAADATAMAMAFVKNTRMSAKFIPMPAEWSTIATHCGIDAAAPDGGATVATFIRSGMRHEMPLTWTEVSPVVDTERIKDEFAAKYGCDRSSVKAMPMVGVPTTPCGETAAERVKQAFQKKIEAEFGSFVKVDMTPKKLVETADPKPRANWIQNLMTNQLEQATPKKFERDMMLYGQAFIWNLEDHGCYSLGGSYMIPPTWITFNDDGTHTVKFPRGQKLDTKLASCIGLVPDASMLAGKSPLTDPELATHIPPYPVCRRVETDAPAAALTKLASEFGTTRKFTFIAEVAADGAQFTAEGLKALAGITPVAADAPITAVELTPKINYITTPEQLRSVVEATKSSEETPSYCVACAGENHTHRIGCPTQKRKPS